MKAKRFSAFFLILCFILILAACNSSEGPNALRGDLEEHEFLGVTFYLPSDFSQSNIFADADTGRICYTNPQGITVLINVSETSFIRQYYSKDIFDAQSYAQVSYDAYSTDPDEGTSVETELSSKYTVPYIRLCGNIDESTHFGFMGFYYSDTYCATISVHTENEHIFTQNKENMINFATIATFMR